MPRRKGGWAEGRGPGWGGAQDGAGLRGLEAGGERVGIPGTGAHAHRWLRLRDGLGRVGGAS